MDLVPKKLRAYSANIQWVLYWHWVPAFVFYNANMIPVWEYANFHSCMFGRGLGFLDIFVFILEVANGVWGFWVHLGILQWTFYKHFGLNNKPNTTKLKWILQLSHEYRICALALYPFSQISAVFWNTRFCYEFPKMNKMHM